MCAVWKRRKIIIHPHLKIVNCINESGNSNPALKSYWDYICMKERDLLANIQYENMQVCLPHSRVKLFIYILFFTLLKKLLGAWGMKLEHIVVAKSKQLNSYTYGVCFTQPHTYVVFSPLFFHYFITLIWKQPGMWNVFIPKVSTI